MDELAALIADMDPTVQLGLVIGIALCLTGAVIVGLLARGAYLRRLRRKSKRARQSAPTRVFRPFEPSDAVRPEQMRQEGCSADGSWRSWETVAHGWPSDAQTQVLHFDSAGRRQPR